MKIKNFASFVAVLLVLALGVWACSNYAGGEPFKKVEDSQHSSAVSYQDSILSLHPLFINYYQVWIQLSISGYTDSLLMQEVVIRRAHLLNGYSGFNGLSEAQINLSILSAILISIDVDPVFNPSDPFNPEEEANKRHQRKYHQCVAEALEALNEAQLSGGDVATAFLAYIEAHESCCKRWCKAPECV